MKQEQCWQLLTTEWSKHDKSLPALLLGRLNIYLGFAIKNFSTFYFLKNNQKIYVLYIAQPFLVVLHVEFIFDLLWPNRNPKKHTRERNWWCTLYVKCCFVGSLLTTGTFKCIFSNYCNTIYSEQWALNIRILLCFFLSLHLSNRTALRFYTS